MTNHRVVPKPGGSASDYVIIWRNSEPPSDLMEVEWKALGNAVGSPHVVGTKVHMEGWLAGLAGPTAPRAVVWGHDEAGVCLKRRLDMIGHRQPVLQRIENSGVE